MRAPQPPLPQKTYVFYSTISIKLPPPLSLEGLCCCCQPRLAWGQVGKPCMGHQTIFHSMCLTTGNSTRTTHFIISAATVPSMPTLKSIHPEAGTNEEGEQTSYCPVPLFQSMCFPVTEQKKSPGQAEETNRQYVLQPRPRKPAALQHKGTWCRKSCKAQDQSLQSCDLKNGFHE